MALRRRDECLFLALIHIRKYKAFSYHLLNNLLGEVHHRAHNLEKNVSLLVAKVKHTAGSCSTRWTLEQKGKEQERALIGYANRPRGRSRGTKKELMFSLRMHLETHICKHFRFLHSKIRFKGTLQDIYNTNT